MARKKSNGFCVYCGVGRATTVDHVPPKLFFHPPYPNNLRTVPACSKCNSSFQKDDEYTRFAVSIDLAMEHHDTVRSNLPSVLRSLQRPAAQAFATYLRNNMTPTAILGLDGRPMAQIFEVDRQRVNATGKRILRGFYFLEMGVPIPAQSTVKVACKLGLTAKDPDILEIARNGEVGPIFSYVAGVNPKFSVWLFMLYGYLFWLCTISNSPNVDKAATT